LQIMKKLLALSFYFLVYCSPKIDSNFGVNEFEGVFLDGKSVKFSELSYDRIALNVYSPTCVPCVKEIPALNYIVRQILGKKNLALFMVVDPYQLVENSEKMQFDEIFPKVKEVMQKEILARNIQFPVIVMKRPFRVNPEGGLVTGTPETLLFKTKPLSLYYNFIGPISEANELSVINQDAKILFFLRMLGG